MYKLISRNGVIDQDIVQKIANGAFIPFDEANTDYQAYLKFLEEGGQPLPADEVSGE